MISQATTTGEARERDKGAVDSRVVSWFGGIRGLAVVVLVALTAGGCGSSHSSQTPGRSAGVDGVSVVRSSDENAGPAAAAGKRTPLVSNVQIGTIRGRCAPTHSAGTTGRATLALRAYANAPDEVVVVSVGGHRVARKNVHDGGRLTVRVPLRHQSKPGTFPDETPAVTWKVTQSDERSSLRSRVVMRVASKVGGGCEPARLTLRLANHSHAG